MVLVPFDSAPGNGHFSRRRSRAALALGGALLTVLAAAPASAKPEAPTIFCSTYPDSPACTGRLAECSLCHSSTQPVTWNAFGMQLISLEVAQDFKANLPKALHDAESLDSDGDGVTNGDEIAAGTSPAQAGDTICAAPEAAVSGTAPEGFDYQLARRRVSILYCGHSPTFDEMQAFNAGNPDETTLHTRLHEALDTCLASDVFRDETLHRIADSLIRPVAAVGYQSTSGIKLADYDFDYRLFAYAMTGDRDTRELLTAQYHVTEGANGVLQRVEGVVPTNGGNGPQPLDPGRRAGMITTQWFFVINTMFSALPRTTAAQAYRAYLGQDMALQQGVFPVEGEPVDVDAKNIKQAACAQCHSTLDPLAYAFTYYNGIAGTNKSGTYDALRPTKLIPGWSNNQTYLFGQPVTDVVEWAKVASDTDYFRRNIAKMLFEHANGRLPSPRDEEGFVAAWKSMPEDGHSARRLIHRLVDLPSFGGLQ